MKISQFTATEGFLKTADFVLASQDCCTVSHSYSQVGCERNSSPGLLAILMKNIASSNSNSNTDYTAR